MATAIGRGDTPLNTADKCHAELVRHMRRIFPSTLLLAFILIATSSASACEISLPEAENLPDSISDPNQGFIWVGSPALAALVPEGGLWNGMGPQHHFRDKWWWWREGFNAYDEPKPELEITAILLDGDAPPVHVGNATSGMSAHNPPRWHRILIGMEFPKPGCWEVTANYHGHELRFVFLVGR